MKPIVIRLAVMVLMLQGLLLIGSRAQAQSPTSFDLQFQQVLNDGKHFEIKAQVKANGGKFALGTSNFIFSYTASALDSPTIAVPHHFSGGAYQAMVLGGSGSNVSINVELNTLNTGTDTVQLAFTDIATIRFRIIDTSKVAQFSWDAVNTVVYKDDEATLIPAGTLTGFTSGPLPIQLASFTAVTLSAKQVKLSWSTLSEVDNLGFDVQKSADSAANFQTIPGSFQAGHGTTTERHDYTYTDTAAAPNTVKYYRLRQTDQSAAVHYSDAIKVTGPTGVAEDRSVHALPANFALDQNYPNPFNPTTMIRFALPRASRITLVVYNILGQQVATLVDGVREAGYYTIPFSANNLASGLYFYRLTTDETSFLKKMMLIK